MKRGARYLIILTEGDTQVKKGARYLILTDGDIQKKRGAKYLNM